MRDSIFAGVVAGIVGGTLDQAIVWALSLLGIAKVTPLQLGAYVVTRPGTDITALPAQALGAVPHYALSFLFGVIGVLMLRRFGTDHLGIKGLTYGAVVYFLAYSLVGRATFPVPLLQPDPATSVAFLFGNLAFGLATVFTAGYFLEAEERG